MKDVYDREMEVERRKEERRKAEEEAKRKVEEERRKEQEAQRQAQLAKERQEQAKKEEEQKRAEAEKQQKETEKKQKEAMEQQAVTQRKAVDQNYGSEEAIRYADERIAKVRHIKETIDKQVKSNRAMMNEALRYRMQFTLKIGAVTNSRRFILQFMNDINGLLNKGKQTSELLYAWLLNNLAKQFIKQAENEVAVNFKKAFPLASLCLLLVCQHPEFLDFVLGRLYKKCPYLIPKYHRKEPSDSADDLRKKAGYRRRDDVEWENEEQFQERMNGMMAFLAAMVQTDLRPCTPISDFT